MTCAIRATLNEGRGANPGDTKSLDNGCATVYVRSTKAGARTPATPRRSGRRTSRRGALNEGRGANPGDTRCRGRPRPCPAPLNEGRGANPGDTRIVGAQMQAAGRSTKAGARTPATRVRRPRQTRVLIRSTKAGARTPATPDGVEGPLEALLRSTKAGARTPATRWPPGSRARAGAALNEGRGANPGDTQGDCENCHHVRFAQRRPGREPRRHDSGSTAPMLFIIAAQRRPGREPRRHVGSPSTTRPSHFAQRRPGREPRRHLYRAMTSAAIFSMLFIIAAQRRPGREPRRHVGSPSTTRPSHFAQRRPGREPRRHAGGFGVVVVQVIRSTKAGARTPATPEAGVSDDAADAAQRRPGREPRRHLLPD